MRRYLTQGTITLSVPATAAVVLGLVAGALQVLNQVVFTYSASVQAGVAVVIVFLAGIGISPLVGPAFRNALHLPGWAYTVIEAILSAAVLAATTIPMSGLVHSILAAAITIASALGFAPNVIAVSGRAAKPPMYHPV